MAEVKNNLPPLPSKESLMWPKGSPERIEAENKTKVAYEARYANASLTEKARLMLAKNVSGEYEATLQYDYLKK